MTAITRAEEAIARAEIALQSAKANLDQAQREAVNARVPEPENGSVVSFWIRYTPGGIQYRFAAIRVGNWWYVTGQDTSRRTWSQLVTWITSQASWSNVVVMQSAQLLTLAERSGDVSDCA